jgi:hypothetical protein
MANPCHNAMQPDSCITCKERHVDWFCNLSPQALVEFDALGIHITVPPGGTLFLRHNPRAACTSCVPAT